MNNDVLLSDYYFCPNTGKRMPYKALRIKELERNVINEHYTIAKECYCVKKCPYCGKEHDYNIIYTDIISRKLTI